MATLCLGVSGLGLRDEGYNRRWPFLSHEARLGSVRKTVDTGVILG